MRPGAPGHRTQRMTVLKTPKEAGGDGSPERCGEQNLMYVGAEPEPLK